MEITSKRGSWRGLIQKEWLHSKWEVLTLVFLNVAVALGLPVTINKVFDSSQDVSDSMLIVAEIWLLAHMFIGLKLLYTSLGREMKRPDVWLHSPASVLQLVGAKVVFAALINAVLLVVGGVLLSLSFYLFVASRMFSLMDGVLILVSALFASLLISIFVMAIGFFFWSIYQVLRSRIGSSSLIFTLLLFFGSTYLLEKISFPRVFDTIKAFGAVKLTDAKFYTETNYNFISVIVPDGVIFSIGGLLVYGGIAAILFVLGSVLFEKKVRY